MSFNSKSNRFDYVGQIVLKDDKPAHVCASEAGALVYSHLLNRLESASELKEFLDISVKADNLVKSGHKDILSPRFKGFQL